MFDEAGRKEEDRISLGKNGTDRRQVDKLFMYFEYSVELWCLRMLSFS